MYKSVDLTPMPRQTIPGYDNFQNGRYANAAIDVAGTALTWRMMAPAGPSFTSGVLSRSVDSFMPKTYGMGLAAEGIGDSALVVRGGNNTVSTLTKAIGTHPSGVTGVSVESAEGATVEELSAGLPHSNVGVTTVGDVRAAGGDVIQTSGASANHATMTGLTPEQMNQLFNIIPNPAK